MNAGHLLLPTAPVLAEFYDGDYPSASHGRYPENFDEITAYQGVRHDVDRYREIARATPGPVLELCCGTGRVAIPLAEDGHAVTAVDFSGEMLAVFRANLARRPVPPPARLELIEQDITRLALPRREFGLIVCAFNSLLTIPDFDGQRAALARAREHLAPGGRLVLDVVNPLALDLKGDDLPRPFFTRRHPESGNPYTRFAMRGPVDECQVQRLHGWYDEVRADGSVRRAHYSLSWRPIFRYELAMMLREARLDLVVLEGGHRGEAFHAASPHLFVQAVHRR